LGAGDRIQFRGQLTAGAAVRAELDCADVFVLPSFQEGLPRAMVEAMARALPCIGSTVGGIPELLSADALVPPGDSVALAAVIRAVVSDPQRLRRMSCENLETARQYRQEILREKRIAFYQYVREQTSAWRAGKLENSRLGPPCQTY
jgi:glycosyltransferase involved in cell wall biosynthesis